MLSLDAIARRFESSSGCVFLLYFSISLHFSIYSVKSYERNVSLLKPTKCRKMSQFCATIQAAADDIQ